jgi:hypothetical protein
LKLCVYVAVLFSALLTFGAPSSILDMCPPITRLSLADLRDSFQETHNGHPHKAIDILEPRGTPVHAVVSGSIRKLLLSKPGGTNIYQFGETGIIATTTRTWTGT